LFQYELLAADLPGFTGDRRKRLTGLLGSGRTFYGKNSGTPNAQA
jgi:hypothetical protein